MTQVVTLDEPVTPLSQSIHPHTHISRTSKPFFPASFSTSPNSSAPPVKRM
jgi:hypothetical protein